MSPQIKDAICIAAFGAFVAVTFPGMILDAAEHELDKRQPAPAVECETDTECLAHCPPPADDPDCDGGPELIGTERGR